MNAPKKMPAPRYQARGTSGKHLQKKNSNNFTTTAFHSAIKTWCIDRLMMHFYEDSNGLTVQLAVLVWLRFGEGLVSA